MKPKVVALLYLARLNGHDVDGVMSLFAEDACFDIPGRLVRCGKRYGYGLFLFAVAAFVVGAVAGFSEPLVDSIVVAMLVGSILLIPAIVFGYGLRAAERDDRERAAEASRRKDRGRRGEGTRP